MDPRRVLPAVLDDHPRDREHDGQVGTGLDVDHHPAVILGVSDAAGASRQEEDRALAVLDAGHDPVGEQDGLRFVRVCPAHQQDLGIAPVLVRRPEIVEARIAEAGRRRHVRRRVVEGEVRRPHIAQRVFGDGVGVLHVAVGERLDAVGVGAVRIEHVVAHLGRDIEREVPRHRHQHAEHAHQRRTQPVARGRLRVVDLLRDGAAPDRGVAGVVDEVRVLVGDDDDVVGLAVVKHDVVLVGGDPGAQRLDREVGVQRVLVGGRPARPAAPHRPAIDLVAAGDDAVVAGGRDDLRVRRRQRHALFGDVVGSGHASASSALKIVEAAVDQAEHAGGVDVVALKLQQHLRQRLVRLP